MDPDQLAAQLETSTAELLQMLGADLGPGAYEDVAPTGAQAAPPPGRAPADAPVVPPPGQEAGAPPPEEMAPPDALSLVPPEIVQKATGMLVSLGLLPQPSNTVTPQVIEAVGAFAETVIPGMFTGDPMQVANLLYDLANGEMNGPEGPPGASPLPGGPAPGGPSIAPGAAPGAGGGPALGAAPG